MEYVLYRLKGQMLLVLTMISLFAWASIATALALANKDKLLLIGIDQNGSRIMTSSDDPLLRLELVNFIRRFISLLYNFDEATFDEQVGLATDLMSKNLWEKEKEKILKLSASVKEEGISLSSTIKSITKMESGEIRVVVHTARVQRMKRLESEILLTLIVVPVKRNLTNPWGMEIDSILEGVVK